MSENLYHMAILNTDTTKLVFHDMPLDAAVKLAKYVSSEHIARANRAYQWVMDDGRLIVVERAEDGVLPFVKAVGMFDEQEPAASSDTGDER